ncbi:hypothetical protein NPIL_330981 [Nephila pilipes]|uniref:Uncharacterized protein n=1 Tax=Nephila pilipes TaxID=299642 RepID=A0A8X6TKF5_NEPPI|nr:hypothetical protein NPIL_330981 [Nephila pilipes]
MKQLNVICTFLVLYDTPKRSDHWLSLQDTVSHCSRSLLHPRKIIDRIWWTGHQEVHYKMTPRDQTVIADQYSQQLEHVQQTLQKKDPAMANSQGVLLFHDKG